MIRVTIDNLNEARYSLQSFGKAADRMLNRVLIDVAREYKKFVIRNFLSGQYLGQKTGKTKDSMIAYRGRGEKNTVYVGSRLQNRGVQFVNLAHIYEHNGGADPRPTKAKVLHFIGDDGKDVFIKHAHLPQKAFIGDSSRQFPFNSQLESSADKIIEKEIKSRGLE
jgi:hypothetical protein